MKRRPAKLRILGGVIAVMSAATLTAVPAAGAPASCRLVSPDDAHVFSQGEPQQLVANCVDSTGLPVPYTASIVVRNAVTSAVVTTVDSAPSLSGLDATATAALPPGTYRWHLSSQPPSSGRTFGVSSLTPIISATCGAGPSLIDGFVERLYVRARTHVPQPDVAWVCLRAEDTTGLQRSGGRLEVVSADPAQPLTVTQDTAPCGPPPPGVVPVPLPVEVGDPTNPTTSSAYTAMLADVRVADNQLKLCLEIVQGHLGAMRGSVLIAGLDMDAVDAIRFVPDVDQSHVTARPSWSGNSAACVEGGIRWLDADIMGTSTRFFSYQYVNGATRAFCLRVDRGSAGQGGRLTVYQGNPQAAVPQVINDTSPPDLEAPESPCEWRAFVLGPFAGRYDDNPSKPALCFRAPGFGVDVLVIPGSPDLPVVDWAADAGTPDTE